MADAKAANEDAFAKLCSKTSTDYPFTIRRKPAPKVNTTKVSVLWPVLLSTCFRAAEFSICHHYSAMALRDALNTNRDLRIRARRHAAQPSTGS